MRGMGELGVEIPASKTVSNRLSPNSRVTVLLRLGGCRNGSGRSSLVSPDLRQRWHETQTVQSGFLSNITLSILMRA